jgi:hypothetical protein
MINVGSWDLPGALRGCVKLGVAMSQREGIRLGALCQNCRGRAARYDRPPIWVRPWLTSLVIYRGSPRKAIDSGTYLM